MSSCLYFKTQRFGDRIQSPKRCVLKYKQDILVKDEMMDDVQELNKYTNLPSSQIFRSELGLMTGFIGLFDTVNDYTL
jgi:hypothetical protein